MKSHFDEVRKTQKPKVSKIVIKRMVDENPDLSYLGRFSDSSVLKSEDEIVFDRGGVPREYRFFIAANVENKKQVEENYQRMMKYERGDISDYGIMAEAEVLVPEGRGNYTVQTIHSGGLWGNPSDSDASYLKEIEDEQIEELKRQLRAFGVKSIKGVPIVRGK